MENLSHMTMLTMQSKRRETIAMFILPLSLVLSLTRAPHCGRYEFENN